MKHNKTFHKYPCLAKSPNGTTTTYKTSIDVTSNKSPTNAPKNPKSIKVKQCMKKHTETFLSKTKLKTN